MASRATDVTDPRDPACDPDPYPAYAKLREEAPVWRLPLPNGLVAWMVTRYEDVRLVLGDQRFGRDLGKAPGRWPRGRRPPSEDAHRLFGKGLLNVDPPDHTRLRRLVSREFGPRRVEELRPRVQAITDDLLDRIAPLGRADLIADLALPLPVLVICELLGVPFEDRHAFREWSNAIVLFSRRRVAGDLEAAQRGLRRYLEGLIEDKRRRPADDLLSALVALREEGDRLSDDELLAMAALLLIAGHETTVNLIGNGMLALLQHPAELAALRADPSLVPSAVEELLRFDGPVETATWRLALEPVELHGHRIEPGDLVIPALAAANHDPERFPDPDRLDVRRDDAGHVAFGHGVHFCLGAPLARLEGQIALAGILRRLPDLTLAVPVAELKWRRSMIRGLESLPVTFTPSGGVNG
ncbi:MAG TPA: cytochrome P450 [Candidatus Dormibacteraeota bacterium]|nr:cytochrome P450 [Candidatus Dormibacteraeota bacterium]